MTNETLVERLRELEKNAPPRPWFKCDHLPYLHFTKDGTLPTDKKSGWNYPVVGRFDYGAGALEYIAALAEAFPQLDAEISRLTAELAACRVAAIEECESACVAKIGEFNQMAQKRMNESRANDALLWDGRSSGAEYCLDAIRALKGQK